MRIGVSPEAPLSNLKLKGSPFYLRLHLRVLAFRVFLLTGAGGEAGFVAAFRVDLVEGAEEAELSGVFSSAAAAARAREPLLVSPVVLAELWSELSSTTSARAREPLLALTPAVLAGLSSTTSARAREPLLALSTTPLAGL